VSRDDQERATQAPAAIAWLDAARKVDATMKKRTYVLTQIDLVRALTVGAVRCGLVGLPIDAISRLGFQQVDNGAILTFWVDDDLPPEVVLRLLSAVMQTTPRLAEIAAWSPTERLRAANWAQQEAAHNAGLGEAARATVARPEVLAAHASKVATEAEDPATGEKPAQP
jgi:hypothetical protein